jgi:hypothetical protein
MRTYMLVAALAIASGTMAARADDAVKPGDTLIHRWQQNNTGKAAQKDATKCGPANCMNSLILDGSTASAPVQESDAKKKSKP